MAFDPADWSERLLGPGHVDAWRHLEAEGAAASCCSVQWRADDIAFRCQDCEADPNCVVCPECFFGADHRGHAVSLIRTTGGCCDCGDPSSWKPEGFCSRHRGITEREDSEQALLDLPQPLQERCRVVLAEAVDFADSLLEELAAHRLLENLAAQRSAGSAGPDRDATGSISALKACLQWMQSIGEASFGLRYAMRTAVTPKFQAWIYHTIRGKREEQHLLQGFFIAIVQQSPQLKCIFSAACLDRYEDLSYDHTGRDPHVIAGLTVQLFSIPEVALVLCRDHGMVPRVCGFLAQCLDQGGLELGERKTDPVRNQVGHIVSDLRYVLQSDVVCDFVLRHEESRRAITEVLRRLWRMHPQVRRIGVHVQYESQVWQHALNIDFSVELALRPLQAAARRLPQPLALAWYKELLDVFREVAELCAPGGDRADQGDEGAGEGAGVGCSFHIQILRFLTQSLPYSALLRPCPAPRLCSRTPGCSASVFAEELNAWLELFSPQDLSLMMREALRPYIFSAEVRAGLWVRNGDSLREQCECYSRSWQAQDVLTIQVATVLLGVHFARSPQQALEPLRQLWCHALLGSSCVGLLPSTDPGSTAPVSQAECCSLQVAWRALQTGKVEQRDVVRVEAFWEIAGRVASEAWLADVCEAQQGSPEWSSEGARAALRRWILHLLAERPVSASELDKLLPRGWKEHPAKDEALRSVATGKVGDDGVTKFELKGESWRSFDCFHIVDGQRQPPEAEEKAIKHQSDLLGPGREPSCQDWQDAVLEAWGCSPLTRMARELVRARVLAHQVGDPMPFPGALPWVLKLLDMVQFGRRLGRDEPCMLQGMLAQPATLGLGSPVQLIGPHEAAELSGAAGFLGALRGDLVTVHLQDGNAVEVHGESCTPQVEATCWEDLRAALQALKEREAGTLAHLCSRLVARAQQTGDTTAAGDQAAKQQAKRRQLAARQQFMLQSMAARQQSFMVTAQHRGDEEEDKEGEAVALCCDVCREPASASRPICLLGHACRSNVLQALVQHSDFSEEVPAVSSCGHVMHADCFQRHQEYFRQHRNLHDIFNLTQPGDGCVPCPMCRAIVSIPLPVLPPGHAFGDAEGAAPCGPVPLAEAVLQHLPRPQGADCRLALLEACALQVLTTSVVSPARAVPGDRAPPVYVVLLRLLSLVLPAGEAAEAEAEELPRRDPKRILLEALGTCKASAAAFRELLRQLTEVRLRQLLGAHDDVSEGLAEWLVFAAWVASGIWTFEARDLNLLAHLPDEPEARVAALWRLLLLSPPGHEFDGSLASSLRGLAPVVVAPVRDRGGLVPFAPLPAQLLELVQNVYKKPCKQCGTVPKEPCVCLVCGAVICAGSESCGAIPTVSESKVGSCGRHARACGADQGLFLAPYWGRVVAISGSMLGIWEYPYVDAYGEAVVPRSAADLTLDSRRLERLRAMYSTGTVALEIMRHNQRTNKWMRGQL